ncbi:MAG: hypothetical protein H8E82_04540 [Candidatus Marinimicrobia bacterium]|nr:hypothetical protein [Candidatus Neomarinimicrobiota bacterium]MBL7046149.1 hypothetical protein [Candidatus Neomarinimicrobiota bacterium]
MFQELIGHEHIWERLLATYEGSRIAGAYLFHGPSGTGKEGMAVKFTALVNCLGDGERPCGVCPSCKKCLHLQHPNLTLIVPFPRDKNISKNSEAVKALSPKSLTRLEELLKEKGENLYAKIALPKAETILLNSIRDLRKSIYLKAAEWGRKMILIFDAHQLMTQQGEAGNALLKILEEPPNNTTFILTTDHPEQLAETILSRCHKVYFPPISNELVEKTLISSFKKDKPTARLISHLAQGDFRTAQQLAQEKLENIEYLVKQLVSWISSETKEGWQNFLNHGIIVHQRSNQEFFNHLMFLTYWFRDAMHLQKLDGKATLILEPMAEDIKKFVDAFPEADFSEIVMTLEMCSDSLSRHYNLNLVLINLMLDIQEQLLFRQ